jgi:predicted metal-dependent phosphotriesterase family hydrolase
VSNFADNFATLCDRVTSIMTLLKEDKPYSRRGKGVVSVTETRVFNFGDDIAAIRDMAERIELRILKHIGILEMHAADMALIINKLVSLRLDAPNSMFVEKIVKKKVDDETDVRHEPVRKKNEKKQ